MLLEAKRQAEKILGDARQEAQRHAEMLYEDARRNGWETGHAEGVSQGSAQAAGGKPARLRGKTKRCLRGSSVS